MAGFINRVGHCYGRLKVLERAHNRGKKIAWKCICTCGIITTTVFYSSKQTQSCGCIRRERFLRDLVRIPETDPEILQQRKARRTRLNKEYWYKSKYGLSITQVKQMSIAQNGLCAICNVEVATDVDHNHLSGKVRALLCGTCNAALGLFKDNPAFLRNAANYLESYE